MTYEHRELALRRSRRAWRTIAVTAVVLLAGAVAQPEALLRTHGRLPAPAGIGPGGSAPLAMLPDRLESGRMDAIPAARADWEAVLAASLERDRHLAARFGAVAAEPERIEPAQAYTVSRFPLSGQREVEITTAVLPDRGLYGDGKVVPASVGGVW